MRQFRGVFEIRTLYTNPKTQRQRFDADNPFFVNGVPKAEKCFGNFHPENPAADDNG